MSRELKDLDPKIRAKAETAFKKMKVDRELKALGVTDIFINETKRELSTQMAYYSRSRMSNIEDVKKMYKAAGLYIPSDAECKTANTWTLESKHLKGLAVDFVPMKNGALWWNAPAAVWQRIGVLGEISGLAWGGRWKNKDCPHFEI